MCTVSFIPKSNGGFILTSNRDESPTRITLPPEFYTLEGVDLLFPKDEKAGGTWIGLSDRKRLICLLNGGFKPHIPKKNYRLSRGVIVTDLLQTKNFVSEIDLYNFENIEPFTILLIDYKNELHLYELVWDGNKKYFSEKKLTPTIWSSSLLYDKKIRNKREYWFSEFINSTEDPSQKEILNFHKTAGDGNIKTNLVMDRSFVRTKSITTIQKTGNCVVMNYEDLQSQKINSKKI